MSLETFNYLYIMHVENYIEDEWVYGKDASFMKKHVLSRGAYFLLSPASFIASALDAIVGLGVGLKALCYFGKDSKSYYSARVLLKSSGELMARPYASLLSTLNPKAEFDGGRKGVLTNFVKKRLKKTAEKYSKSYKFNSARATYGILALSCIVTRAVDGVLSIPAVALTIVSAGTITPLNNFAYRSLHVGGIVDDLFYCTIKVINPLTGNLKR